MDPDMCAPFRGRRRRIQRLAVQVECRLWDAQRDLALMKVVAVETEEPKAWECQCFDLCHCRASAQREPHFFLGRDDLDSTSEKRTTYSLVEVSQGTFRGMVDGKDPQDSFGIGTLMHDARIFIPIWTRFEERRHVFPLKTCLHFSNDTQHYSRYISIGKNVDSKFSRSLWGPLWGSVNSNGGWNPSRTAQLMGRSEGDEAWSSCCCY
ncbi:hypothetical protein D0Z07_4266 [Hyphodiscus hymeniophilus]|uniref:Uncharacterized protein n=1 Tax=Hyphodiscus hymeniophilus TaxID=353542 RepID=A0A9P6VK51_9HELO|nr:hypothetical protein D0Z07_4266 [Hyphodiscus hymeniophilus]